MRNRLLPALAGALALVAIVAAAALAADEAPTFDLGRVGHPRTGVVTIRVSASSGGYFVAGAKLIETAQAKGREAGAFTLELKLTERGLAKLRQARGRQLRLAVEFAFTPSAGAPSTKVKKLIFRVVEKHPKR